MLIKPCSQDHSFLFHHATKPVLHSSIFPLLKENTEYNRAVRFRCRADSARCHFRNSLFVVSCFTPCFASSLALHVLGILAPFGHHYRNFRWSFLRIVFVVPVVFNSHGKSNTMHLLLHLTRFSFCLRFCNWQSNESTRSKLHTHTFYCRWKTHHLLEFLLCKSLRFSFFFFFEKRCHILRDTWQQLPFQEFKSIYFHLGTFFRCTEVNSLNHFAFDSFSSDPWPNCKCYKNSFVIFFLYSFSISAQMRFFWGGKKTESFFIHHLSWKKKSSFATTDL